MHHGAIVDMRLAKFSSWKEGESITLYPDEVHDYGIELRTLAYAIHEDAVKRHFNNKN